MIPRHARQRVLLALTAAGLAGCGASARLPITAGMGPNPTLPTPTPALLPTVNAVTAKGWSPGATPVAAEGTFVTAYAQGLDHPRWLYVLPNGDVLVAETNAPPRPEDGRGIKGWFFRRYQTRAGGAVPSANRITLLRDTDGDGVAETRTAFLSGLNSPFGMALVGNALYVANSDAVVRFPYQEGDTRIDAPGVKLVDLPAGARNHHWTKSLVASPDGSKLYVGVGSNSNIAEYGLEEEEGRAAVWEVDAATGSHRIFASGLRNAVGLAFQMPMVVYALAAVGLIRARQLAQQWRLAIVIIAVIAAAVTPTVDPVNMALVMLPMILLYGFSIVGASVAERARRRDQASRVLAEQSPG